MEMYYRMNVTKGSVSVKIEHLLYDINICYMGESFQVNTEFRILRLTFHRKSASKC